VRYAALLLALAAGCAAPETPTPAPTPAATAEAEAPGPETRPRAEREPRGSVVLMDGEAANLRGDEELYALLAAWSRELGVTIVVDEGVVLSGFAGGGLPARDAIDVLARMNRCEIVYRPPR